MAIALQPPALTVSGYDLDYRPTNPTPPHFPFSLVRSLFSSQVLFSWGWAESAGGLVDCMVIVFMAQVCWDCSGLPRHPRSFFPKELTDWAEVMVQHMVEGLQRRRNCDPAPAAPPLHKKCEVEGAIRWCQWRFSRGTHHRTQQGLQQVAYWQRSNCPPMRARVSLCTDLPLFVRCGAKSGGSG